MEETGILVCIIILFFILVITLAVFIRLTLTENDKNNRSKKLQVDKRALSQYYKRNSGVRSFDTLKLKKEGIIIEPEIRDAYITSFANGLFDLHNKKITKNGIINKSEEVLLVTTYHHNNTQKNVDENCDKKILVLDGEPKSLFDLPLKNDDFLLTTKKDPSLLPSVSHQSIYLPYYAYFMAYEKKISSQSLKNKKVASKRKFCVFAYSNCDEKFDGVRDRNKFYQLFQKMSNNRVDNLGKCCGGRSTGNVLSNAELFSDYKFVIAFENQQIKGYITEKITNPMISGCIPIYLGAEDVSEHFNPKSFINVRDFPSFESCIEYVLKVDRDDELYQKILSEEWLSPNNKFLDNLEQKGSEFYQQVYSMIPKNLILLHKFFKEKINYMTFSDGKKYTYDRILEEALTSNYFDTVSAYLPKDLDPVFMKKHQEFISSNPRGYGYYIWKPQIILQALEKCQDGDYLIWTDSGSVIQSGNSEKMLENILRIDENGILTFKIHYKNKSWIKKKLISTFMEKYSIQKEEMEKWLGKYQITSGVLFMRKCLNSLKIITEWRDLMENYNLINDVTENEEPYFREHRHDQSVLSLLSEYYNLPNSYDNFSDSYEEPFFPDGSPLPIWLARKENPKCPKTIKRSYA